MSRKQKKDKVLLMLIYDEKTKDKKSFINAY